MAGIYQRDNINYGGMLGNAMANKANFLQRRYDRVAQMGQNWGNAVQQNGKTIQDALYKIAGNYYEQDKLAAQQQFQHDEALKRAEEQLARQREQEAWQARQNYLNRKTTMDVALLNKAEGRANRESEARARLEKLYIQKSNLEGLGQDTRDIDVSIAQIMRDYPRIGTQVKEDLAKQPAYDPTQDVRYQLAKYKDVSAKNNDTSDLFQAYNALQPYKTPEAIARLGELEREIGISEAQDELNKQLKSEIDNFKGGLSAKLANNGYTIEYAGPVINLISRTGRIVKQVPRPKRPSTPSNNNWD